METCVVCDKIWAVGVAYHDAARWILLLEVFCCFFLSKAMLLQDECCCCKISLIAAYLAVLLQHWTSCTFHVLKFHLSISKMHYGWYTEVWLVDLQAHKTYAAGTLRKKRAFLPKDVLATTPREVNSKKTTNQSEVVHICLHPVHHCHKYCLKSFIPSNCLSYPPPKANIYNQTVTTSWIIAATSFTLLREAACCSTIINSAATRS